MRKNQVWSIQTMVFTGLLVAIQIVLSRVLMIETPITRITFGTIATILAGLWMGPVVGGIEGAAADLIGGFMKYGLSINPVITLSAASWGIIAGFAGWFLAGKSKQVKSVIICVEIVLSGVIGTLGLTTLGISMMTGTSFLSLLSTRIPQFLLMAPVNCVVTNILYFSPLTELVLKNLKLGELRKRTA